MLLVLLACTPDPPPAPGSVPTPYQKPPTDGRELAGEGDSIPIPPHLEADAVAFRNALIEALTGSGSYSAEGFGTFEVVGQDRRNLSVIFRAHDSVTDTLQGRPPAPDAPSRSGLWAFVLAETAIHAVYVDRIGWFGQKTLPAFSAGGRDVPETTTLTFLPDSDLISAIRP